VLVLSNKDFSVLCFRRYASCLLCVFTLALTGCIGPSETQQALHGLPERVELTGVPAFPERAYFGAPSALGSLLVQHGIDSSPGMLVKQLQLPQQEQQLEQNILTQINANGLLAYPLRPQLAALLQQVAAGYPVLLRFNEGFGWMGMPRYAVLIGYDSTEQTLLLRAGNSRRWETGFSSFASAWESAGSWAVLVLAPLQLPAKVDGPRWLQAADQLERSGQSVAAANARKVLQRSSVSSKQ
jgi:hypothetical protein